jgi:hypothetical protein
LVEYSLSDLNKSEKKKIRADVRSAIKSVGRDHE